jgi:hypothetical protein
MLRRHLVPTRDLRDHRARRVGFRHDLCLDIVAPTTAPGPSLCVNNIRNHVAIRSLHDGTHIEGKPTYNKVGENDRFPCTASLSRSCVSQAKDKVPVQDATHR